MCARWACTRRFVEDMRAFHAEENAIKRGEIAAAREAHILEMTSRPLVEVAF